MLNKNGKRHLKCVEILYEGEYQLLESCLVGDCLVDFSKITAVFRADNGEAEYKDLQHPSTSNSSEHKGLQENKMSKNQQ